MINKVTIKNSYGDAIEIVLRNGSVHGYVISGIEGLEPPKSEIKTEEMAAGRKWIYQRTSYKARDISIGIVYDEYNDYYMSIDQLRTNLQSMVKTGDKVELYFEKDTETYCIEGYVTEHKSTIFSKQCDAKISVTCPDPWFRKTSLDYYEETILYPDDTQVDDYDLDNYLGKLTGLYRSKSVISYDGHVQNGFEMTTIDHDAVDLRGKPLAVTCAQPNKNATIVANIPVSHGTHDTIVLDTDDEEISLKAGERNVIGWVDPSAFMLGADIPEFSYGENEITAYAKVKTEFKLRYKVLYGGL